MKETLEDQESERGTRGRPCRASGFAWKLFKVRNKNTISRDGIKNGRVKACFALLWTSMNQPQCSTGRVQEMALILCTLYYPRALGFQGESIIDERGESCIFICIGIKNCWFQRCLVPSIGNWLIERFMALILRPDEVEAIIHRRIFR